MHGLSRNACRIQGRSLGWRTAGPEFDKYLFISAFFQPFAATGASRLASLSLTRWQGHSSGRIQRWEAIL